MKLFIAGTSSFPNIVKKHRPLYVLESFYYIQEWQIQELKNYKMFLLDSGAFTFMNSRNKAINFNTYLSRYINFINSHDIHYFFELDIDSIVGHDEVKRIRHDLEKGRKNSVFQYGTSLEGLRNT